MRLDEWLKYVEQVENDQVDETSAPGVVSAPEQPAMAGAAEDAEKQNASTTKSRPQPSITKNGPTDTGTTGEPVPIESPRPLDSSSSVVFKSSIEDMSPRLGYMDEEIAEELASASEVIVEAPRSVEQQRPIPRFEEPPLRVEDFDLHIPEIEDFLTFLKDPEPEEPTKASPTKPAATVVPIDNSVRGRASAPTEHKTDNPSTPVPDTKSTAPQTVATPTEKPAPTKSKAPKPESETGDTAAMGSLPRHIQTLARLDADEIAQNSYKRNFREARGEMIERLLDPPLSLEDAARILNVCPTTVRRYTNRGVLPHYRTVGNQRRFRLSDVIAFMETHGERLAKRRQAESSDQMDSSS